MKIESPIKRRKTRQIHIGDVAVGGDAPISVQSMTNTETCDVAATVAQIKALEAVGLSGFIKVVAPVTAKPRGPPTVTAPTPSSRPATSTAR